MKIIKYDKNDEKINAGIVSLIVGTQQNEFDIPITFEDQPDLSNVSAFYDVFWIALEEDKVIGTIGLINLGETGVIRKMFVAQEHRGSHKSIAQKLLATLEAYCRDIGIKQLCLDTVTAFKAAHRFYERNGFLEITAKQLPENYPLVAANLPLDRVYYCKVF